MTLLPLSRPVAAIWRLLAVAFEGERGHDLGLWHAEYGRYFVRRV